MNAQHFRSLATIDSSFKLLRGIMLGIIASVAVICLGVVYWSMDAVEQSRNRVYVMEKGQSLMLALSQEHNVNRSAEAKDHVKTFLKLLFELEPDEKQIEATIGEATYLGNRESVVRLYTDLKEKNYYNQLIQGDVHQKLEVEIANVEVNMLKSPYYFKARARQILLRATTITVRSLVVEGFLVDVQRTDRNAHGMNVENFKILENKDIETITRQVDDIKL